MSNETFHCPGSGKETTSEIDTMPKYFFCLHGFYCYFLVFYLLVFVFIANISCDLGVYVTGFEDQAFFSKVKGVK